MKKILIISISLALLIISVSISKGNYSIIFGSTSFFILTSYQYFKRRFVFTPLFTILVFHLLILTVGILIKGIEKTNFSGNIYIVIFILSCILGWLFMKFRKKISKFIIVVFFIFFTSLNSFYVPKIIENKLFFKTYSGEFNLNLKQKKIYALDYSNKQNIRKVNLNDLNNKTIVIDFWNNNCGVCFEKFPIFSNLQSLYVNNPNVVFYAVNVFKENEEINKGISLFERNGINLKSLYISEKDSEIFNLKGFPTTVVIKNNQIIFKGSVEVLDIFKYSYIDN